MMCSNDNGFRKFSHNLKFHFSEILEYPLAKPYWIYISLSHECTYNCRMCEVVKILKNYALPSDVVKKTIDEIAGWQRDCTVLFTGGEPFLRKDIFDLIDYSVSKGLAQEVVSNGYLIDENKARRIVTCGLQNIAISLDGAQESTHDSVRQPGAYKKAIAAIQNLVQAKKNEGRGPQISVWTTILKENVQELYDIIFLARDLGVECLVYHPVIVAQDDMQKTSPRAPFWVTGEALSVLKGQIAKIMEYRDKQGMVAFLHDPYLWLRYFEGSLSKDDWKCNPFVFLNIGPDGEVRSCGASFGNVKEASLDECLNSKDAFDSRRLMKFCQKPCLQTCWAHPESDSLATIAEKFLTQIKSSSNKEQLIKEAMHVLQEYKKLVYAHAKP